MSFSGLPAIEKQFDELGKKIALSGEELKKIAEQAFKALEDLAKVKKEADGTAGSMAAAVKEAAKLNAQFRAAGAPYEARAENLTVGPPFGELFSPEELIKNIGREVAAQNAASNKGLSDALKDFSDRINKWAGNDQNYWSQLFTKEIPYLTKGARSAEEANGMIAQILNAYLPGMKNELLQNPNMPPEMRKLLEELLHIALSGGFNTGEKLDNIQRAEAERKRQDEIRDILATDRHKLTKAQLDELDKKLKDLQGQGARTGAHVDNVQYLMGGVQGSTSELATSVSTGHKETGKHLESVEHLMGGVQGSLKALATSVSELSSGVTHSGQAVQNSINTIGEHTMNAATGKLAQAAADQKAANKALLDSLNSNTDDLRKQMKEAADQEKKDAEEARKSLAQVGNDLLRGLAASSGWQSQLISDGLERRILGLGD